MKNFILLLGLMLFAGMAMGQFRVTSDGVNHALNSVLMVGEDSNAGETPSLRIGQGRQSPGNSGLDLYSSSGTAREVTLTARANGTALFRHFGSQFFSIRTDAVGSSVQLRPENTSQLIARRNSVEIRGTATVNGGVMVTSDRRLKKNVKAVTNGLDQIMQLRPVSFEYNGKAGTSTERPFIGLIAQELQKVAPEFVSTHHYVETDDNGKVIEEEDVLRIHDSELKYLLIRAVQEQQTIIEGLQTEIADLKESITSNTSVSDDVNLVDVAQSTLGQNSPNPYNEGTVISYSVADNASSAQMNFYNLTGQLIKSVTLQSGEGQVNVSADELPSGTYTYSLEVDGALISNKKMVKMR